VSGAPLLAVVVPSVNGWADLETCLMALERERARTPLEVLVPERCGAPVRAAIAREFPAARVLPVDADVGIPAMRARAIAEAGAPTVAVIEDHVRVGEGWAGRVVALRAAGHRVAGGPLRNGATGRLVDQAAFLCDYSAVLAPQPEGAVEWLPGNNTAYDRVLRAEHCRHYTVGAFLSERFLYSRSFAGLRLAGAGALARAGYGTAAFGLPPVLLARILGRARRAGVASTLLFRALPLLTLFTAAWALGETAGAWLGEGGATARVR